MSDTAGRVRLGGLWQRRTATGIELMTGPVTLARLEEITEIARGWGDQRLQIAVLQNTYKGNPTDPDYVVYLERRQTAGAK